MYRLLSCLTNEHDPVLVAVAAAVCAGSVLSALKAYSHALSPGSHRNYWLLVTGLGMACGIWATHFLAMLAYAPPVPTGFGIGLTLVSLLACMVTTTAGFWIGAGAENGAARSVAGGAVLGAGIGAMHLIGMGGLEVAGTLNWDGTALAVALLLGIGLSAASLWTLHTLPRPRGFWSACVLLVLAICGLHFTAMSAVAIVPDPTIIVSATSLDRVRLALSICALTVIGVGAGIAAMTIERLRGHIDRQLSRLDAEVDVRRRAQENLQASEHRLLAHQAAIVELMREDIVRAGRLEEAMQHLLRVLSRELGVARAGYLLLDKAKTAVSTKSVYVAARGDFTTPEGYGSPRHLSLLMKMSAGDCVAIDDTRKAHMLGDFKELYYDKYGIVSVLQAPIIAHGELVGFLTCTSVGENRAWTAEHRVFALGMANLAAVVIERHQRLELEAAANASAERLARQQQLVTELIGSESLRKGEVEKLFHVVADAVTRIMQVDRVTVRFFPTEGEAEIRAEAYLSQESGTPDAAPRASDTYPAHLARAIAHGPLVSKDNTIDPHMTQIYESRLRPRRLRASIHAPINNDDKLIGVIICSMYDAPRAWGPEDVLLASSAAHVIALAYERRLRLQVEESLRKANQTAEEASLAKSLFLANMSHEIRTPMNGVLGMADLLSRSGLSERQQRLAGTITESARALLTIINDILDISRIEGGKFQLDPHDCEIGALVEDAVELLAEQARCKSLELSLFVDPAASGMAIVDSGRLRQVLVNLIGNAIKFTEQGEVAVRVTPQAVDGRPAMRFAVSDTGVGVEEDIQARLFQPFVQADTSISRRFGGTGLGLSISRHLVEMMGGSIGLESQPGKGTTIWFVLPLEARRGESGLAAEPARLVGRRVLVVDDSQTNREIVSSYMASSGALVEAVADADAAMRCLDSAVHAGRPFDVAIVDLVMPGCDGLALADRIERQWKAARPRLILLSSETPAIAPGEAKPTGIDKVLHKPIRRTDLIDCASSCLMQACASGNAAPAVADGLPPQLRLRVLVAEDNPVNQVVAEEHLASLGCHVMIVEDGRQALAALERAAYDVVLMDCHMPVLDGYAATREIRAGEQATGSPRLPVIAVTANAYDADRQQCLDAGMDAVVTKPYSQEQLADALRDIRPARHRNGADQATDAAVAALRDVAEAAAPVQGRARPKRKRARKAAAT